MDRERKRRARAEESRRVLARLRRDALLLARVWQLPLGSLEPERGNVKRRYGVCYDDGSIRIRLRHVRTRELLKYSSLVDTLCHELAHLRHFDHGPRFDALYQGILGDARRRGIYRPSPRAAGTGRRVETLRVQGSSILPLARLDAVPVRRPCTEPPSRAGGADVRRVPEQLDLFR